MKDLTVFKHEEFGEVRIIDQNGDPWVVLRDVLSATKTTTRPADAKSLIIETFGEGVVFDYPLETAGGIQETTIINESAMTFLVSRSNTEMGRKLNKWIHSVVLPQIRKTGMYMPKSLPEALRAYADALEREEQLKIENQIMLPKAEYFDELVDRKLLTNFRDTAKEFKLKPSRFTMYLLDNNYVYKDVKSKIKPYMKYVPDLFEIKEWQNANFSGTQTLITPKGRETFRLLLRQPFVRFFD